MICWHTMDAWTVLEGREHLPFQAMGFVGGWAAPMFLLLAGVALPYAGAARIARGDSWPQAARALARRGWQVFLIAHLFRLQSFLLNPTARWNGIFKPDILNVLGLGMVVTAWCWRRATSTAAALRWLLLPALIVMFVITPLSRIWWWPTLLPPRLEAYIRPVGNMGVFSLFPSIAYVFIGAWIGSILVQRSVSDVAFHKRLGLGGAAALAVGLAAMFVPFPPVSTIGLSAIIVMRTGAIVVALVAVWWWMRWRPAGRRSPMLVFGRTSLFVYWVHVELAYGVFSYPIRRALPTGWAFVAFVLFTIAMLGLAMLWERRPRGPLVPAHMVAKT